MSNSSYNNNPIMRYKVIEIDGHIRTVYRRRSTMQGFVDVGLAVESLPVNPNSSIYCDEDMIYGGFIYDPLNPIDSLRAYPQLLITLHLMRGGAIRPPV